MTTGYYVPDGRDFDQYFEPDPNGPAVEGYFDAAGNYLRFADVARGSKFPDVAYYRGDGVDLSNVWAGIGTVAYTVPPGDQGSASLYGQITPVRYAGIGNRLQGYLRLVVRNNGLMDLTYVSTNFADDTRRNLGNGKAWNDPAPGRLVQTAQWLANVGAGNGNGYTVEFLQEGAHEWGWKDYPNRRNGNIQIYHPYETRGAFTVIEDQVRNLGEHSLNGDVECVAMFDKRSDSAGNANLADANAALSLYNRGTVRCNIKRNGVIQQTFFFRYSIEGRWFNSRDF